MRKFVSRVCLLLIVFLSPVLVHAAGLGRLTVNSGLGQPFKAEIDLVTVKKEERSSLMVRLAPQEIFRQANVDYVPLLSTFKASIESRSDGNPYIRIISPQPISEPLLNILIELNWPSGRVLREYTVVLAPPEINAHPPPPPPLTPVTQTLLPTSVKAEPATAEKPGIPIKSSVIDENMLVSGPASGSKAHTVYGPVKHGDTLAEIVKNIVPPSGVSFNQMLVAVHRANRDAFFGNNMHQLKTGPILRIPDNSEIGAITTEEADKEVKIQTVDWNRRRLAEEVVAGSEELKQTATGKIESAAGAKTEGSQKTPHGFLKLSQGEAIWNVDNDMGVKDLGRNGAGEKGAGTKRIDGKDSGGMDLSGVQDRIRAMEEDAMARSRALSEANERIALLEKNIKELQRLLELKNLALADMQKRVETTGLDAAALPASSAAILPQAAELIPEPHLANQPAPRNAEADNPEGAMITPLATVESATEIAEPGRAAATRARETDSAPRKPAKSSLMDDVTANIEYFGGALIVLITGIVGVSMIGRPKEASQVNSDGDIISVVPDSRLNEKAISVATSTVTTTGGAPGTDNVTKADEAGPAAQAGTSLDAHDTQSGLAGVSLNVDYTQLAKPIELTDRNTHWHEIVTKLDLARAYQEIGDKDAARQVLEEVAREGDVQQQESARLMLVNL